MPAPGSAAPNRRWARRWRGCELCWTTTCSCAALRGFGRRRERSTLPSRGAAHSPKPNDVERLVTRRARPPVPGRRPLPLRANSRSGSAAAMKRATEAYRLLHHQHGISAGPMLRDYGLVDQRPDFDREADHRQHRLGGCDPAMRGFATHQRFLGDQDYQYGVNDDLVGDQGIQLAQVSVPQRQLALHDPGPTRPVSGSRQRRG